jgi:uncharacterized membrane protein
MVSPETRALERAIEVVLTAGIAVSMALLLWGVVSQGEQPMRWGIVLLMFTPVVRVVVVAVGLLYERDWLFAGISLFVLGILASGMVVAARLP